MTLVLVKQGVDLDVAAALDHHEALAWLVMMGETEGQIWNWTTLSWEQPDG